MKGGTGNCLQPPRRLQSSRQLSAPGGIPRFAWLSSAVKSTTVVATTKVAAALATAATLIVASVTLLLGIGPRRAAALTLAMGLVEVA